MTTSVEIYAGNGRAVEVTPVTNGKKGAVTRIPAGKHGTAFVHANQDLFVHEVQEDEVLPEDQPNASIAASKAAIEKAKHQGTQA